MTKTVDEGVHVLLTDECELALPTSGMDDELTTSIINRTHPKRIVGVALGAAMMVAVLCSTQSSALRSRMGLDSDALVNLEATSENNSALILLKPHAVTEALFALVRKQLDAANISVLDEGSIAAEDIDSKQLIDHHYGALAAKALTRKPDTLEIKPAGEAAFLKTFSTSWSDALKQTLVFNAVDAAVKLGLTNDQLGAEWAALTKVDKAKLGPGFFAGKIKGVYVINGFYMELRKAFTTPGTSVHYFQVEWSAADLPWANFSESVIGTTDPATAANQSIRNEIFKNWKELGLKNEPNMAENGVIASGSPLDALSERVNWLEADVETDPFAQALLASGMTMDTITSFISDPVVQFENKSHHLFDLLDGLNSNECVDKCNAIAAANPTV